MARSTDEMLESLARLVAEKVEADRRVRSLRASIGLTKKHLRKRGVSDRAIDELVARVGDRARLAPAAEVVREGRDAGRPDWRDLGLG